MMFRFIKSLFCKHVWKFARNIYGDEIIVLDYNRSEWVCSRCGKYQWRKSLNQAQSGAAEGGMMIEELNDIAEELAKGTSKCDICGLDTPHYHSPELVEIERFVRPAFEKTVVPCHFFGRIAKNPECPYTEQQTERLWQHFLSGWMASRSSASESIDTIKHTGTPPPNPNQAEKENNR